MTFSTWFSEDGSSEAEVSSYIWVYVLFALVSTTLTIGSGYYFNIWRKPVLLCLEEHAGLV